MNKQNHPREAQPASRGDSGGENTLIHVMASQGQ
jgi:hypothetical protein